MVDIFLIKLLWRVIYTWIF